MILGIFLVYMVMAGQFEDFKDPFIIMFSVPFAFVGVIRALAKAGICLDYVVGTSIGALVPAVYASGEIDALEEVALQLDWKEIAYLFDVVFPKSGLIDGKKVSVFIQNHLNEIKKI